MRNAGGLLPALVAIGFIVGHAAGWLFYRGRLRHLSARMQLRLEHRVAERERRFAVLHDRLLQDVQGLALSLQAVADQLSSEAPVRRRLERVLDRTDELLADARKRVQGGGDVREGSD